MQRTDFHYGLPPDLIAQRPTAERSASRLLVLDGASGAHRDLAFRDLPSLLTPRDLLVFNDTRVVPARLHGLKESGGKIEILLERALGPTTALVHARASKGLKTGARVSLPGGATARMLDREGELFRLEFSVPVLPYFESHGDMPLPLAQTIPQRRRPGGGSCPTKARRACSSSPGTSFESWMPW